MGCASLCCLGKAELGDSESSLKGNDRIRIIHRGGLEEIYRNEIAASKLMEKYPGKCVARPQVFKQSHESILSPEEKLLPGQKYYLIPSSTARKLKRKHRKERKERLLSEKGKAAAAVVVNEQSDGETTDEDFSEESMCSARDFYVSREKWSTSWLMKCQREKQPFVPPISKPNVFKGVTWEPSLTSIQELSP